MVFTMVDVRELSPNKKGSCMYENDPCLLSLNSLLRYFLAERERFVEAPPCNMGKKSTRYTPRLRPKPVPRPRQGRHHLRRRPLHYSVDDLSLEQLSPESLENKPRAHSDAPSAPPARNLTAMSTLTAATQGATSNPISATETITTTSISIATPATNLGPLP